MLTIQNYYKLCGKPVGKMGWKVMYSSEEKDFYGIKLEREDLGLTQYVHLQRNRTQMSGKPVYRFTDAHGTPTQMGVTADYIGNINNLLKSLEHFLP